MAASFVICGRNNGFSKADVRAAALAPVTAYWEAMAGLAQMPTMDIWYAHMDEDQLTKGIEGAVAGIAKEENKAKKAKEKKEQRDEKEEECQGPGQASAEECREGAHPRQHAGSALVGTMPPVALTFYAHMCGWTLARAHARSGDPVVMAEYLGSGAAFGRSITDFSERYADQNEHDYAEFVKAVRWGAWRRSRGV